MGYYNLVYQRGPERFCKEAAAAGRRRPHPGRPAARGSRRAEAVRRGQRPRHSAADGADDRRQAPAGGAEILLGLRLFRLGARASPAPSRPPRRRCARHVERIKRHTQLPVGVGFGIKTPDQAAAVARHADAAVVGSAIVDRVKAGLDESGKPKPDLVPGVLRLRQGAWQTAYAACARREPVIALRCAR